MIYVLLPIIGVITFFDWLWREIAPSKRPTKPDWDRRSDAEWRK